MAEDVIDMDGMGMGVPFNTLPWARLCTTCGAANGPAGRPVRDPDAEAIFPIAVMTRRRSAHLF